MHRSTLSSRAGPSSHKESACQRRTGFHSRGIFAPPLTPRRLPGGSAPWDAPPRTRRTHAALCPSRGAHLLRADAPGAIGAGVAPWDDLDGEAVARQYTRTAFATDVVGVVLIDSARGRVYSSSREARGRHRTAASISGPIKTRLIPQKTSIALIMAHWPRALPPLCVPSIGSQHHDTDGAALLIEACETPRLKAVGVAFNARLDSRSWSAIFPQVLGIHL
ncbi:hypothetical protein MTO96_013883 [Rhipicephalus appendiculatus]